MTHNETTTIDEAVATLTARRAGPGGSVSRVDLDLLVDELQLDVFGEVMDALHQARCHGIAASESGWDLQKAILSHLERIWVEPARGTRVQVQCTEC